MGICGIEAPGARGNVQVFLVNQVDAVFFPAGQPDGEFVHKLVYTRQRAFFVRAVFKSLQRGVHGRGVQRKGGEFRRGIRAQEEGGFRVFRGGDSPEHQLVALLLQLTLADLPGNRLRDDFCPAVGGAADEYADEVADFFMRRVEQPHGQPFACGFAENAIRPLSGVTGAGKAGAGLFWGIMILPGVPGGEFAVTAAEGAEPPAFAAHDELHGPLHIHGVLQAFPQLQFR